MISRLSGQARLWRNILTHRIHTLPVVILNVTSRCNSRCIACSWWQAPGADELAIKEWRALSGALSALHTRRVVFSGGEPLMRPELYEIAGLFQARGMTLELLTNGLTLERHAEQVARYFAGVTVSLDGDTMQLYEQIRGIDGLEQVERGVARLRAISPTLPIRARSVLQRANYRSLPQLVEKAQAMGLSQISFLAADVSSEAYGRRGSAPARPAAPDYRPHHLILDEEQVEEFARVVEGVLHVYGRVIERGFVAQSAQQLRRLPRYYAAQLGREAFPPVVCHAPWVSAVIEADGAVRPCFPQAVAGNIRAKPLQEILGGPRMAFRKGLGTSADPGCARCVCTLRIGLRTSL